MKRPKMILFDYGQTLVNEAPFDGVKGTEAVMRYCTENKYHLTAEQIQREANAINSELGRPTKGAAEFLEYLAWQGIRTGVISNISYCGRVVEQRIRRLFPGHPFEFILATSEYLFRKPNRRIFWLALEKAGLRPGYYSEVCSEQHLEDRPEQCQEDRPEQSSEYSLEYSLERRQKQSSEYSLEQRQEQSSEDRPEQCLEDSSGEVWYIGDQYECDIVGAAEAGLFPVWYTGAMDMPYIPHEEILTVGSWEEVRTALEACENRA